MTLWTVVLPLDDSLLLFLRRLHPELLEQSVQGHELGLRCLPLLSWERLGDVICLPTLEAVPTFSFILLSEFQCFWLRFFYLPELSHWEWAGLTNLWSWSLCIWRRWIGGLTWVWCQEWRAGGRCAWGPTTIEIVDYISWKSWVTVFSSFVSSTLECSQWLSDMVLLCNGYKH